MAVSGDVATTKHVPAWKRLGLKLKYAKETVDDIPVPSENGNTASDTTTKAHSEPSGKLTTESESEPRATKKRKTITESEHEIKRPQAKVPKLSSDSTNDQYADHENNISRVTEVQDASTAHHGLTNDL